jgi:hydrogenase expression/formation protein HypE
VNGLCELLGFEAMSLANEGTFVLAVKKEDENKALEILKRFNENASIIGEVSQKHPKKVVLNSAWGTARFLEAPTGELLPRIC